MGLTVILEAFHLRLVTGVQMVSTEWSNNWWWNLSTSTQVLHLSTVLIQL